MNREILTKAIQKAIDGGWAKDKTWTKQENAAAIALNSLHYKVIIFDHDFAKALWGEEDTAYNVDCLGSGETAWLPAYQMHLQQMVISDDPIKYLGDHL